MKKTARRWILSGLAAFMLTSCGDNGDGERGLEEIQQPLEPSTGDEENGAVAESPEGASLSAQEESGGSEAAGQPEDIDPDREARRKAFITILEDIYFEQLFPQGEVLGYQPGENYDVSANSFAVCDVDGDGEEELIVSYTTTYMAGMTEIIYRYDRETGEVAEELRVFPSLTYHDNGVIEEHASHNHGMASDGAGDFWPYSLYQYDPEQDAYVQIASVDAWSKAWREEDYDGNPFPDEADADGDGIVYFVMTEDKYELKDPKDGAEYQKWRDDCLKGAGELQIPYVKLTTDNIYGLRV